MPKSKGTTKSKSIGDTGSGPKSMLLSTTSKLNGHSTMKLSASGELTRLGMNDRRTPTAISFGSPSDNGSSGSKSTSSGSDWSNLLQKAVSGGINDLFGGGILSDGISYLVSGISSLFGGEDPATPLKRYTLADSQESTLYRGAQGLMASDSDAPATAPTSRGIYTASSGQAKATPLQDAQVVQAVKKALLTSSSLNDIISEL